MTPFLLFLPLAVASADSTLLKCHNETINLEVNATFSLPAGEYAEGQLCLYTLNYPDDMYAMVDVKTNKKQTEIDDWIFIYDLFNHSMSIVTLNNKLFTPNQLRLVINTRKWVYQFIYGSKVEAKNFVLRSISITLQPLNAFNKTEYYPIMMGSQPLVIDPSKLKTGVTYIFDGFPNLAAVFLTNQQKKRDYIAGKLFVYEGDEDNSTLRGTLDDWRGVQYFEKFSIYAGVRGKSYDVGAWNDLADLLLIMDVSTISHFVDPHFILACETFDTFDKSKTYKLDATKGPTFATITQYNQKKEHIYKILDFKPSNDVELVLLDGYARLDYNETEIIERFDASILTKNFMMVLARVKSLVLLKGTLEFSMQMRPFDDFYTPLSQKMTVFARGEDNFPGVTWKIGDYNYDIYFRMKVVLEKIQGSHVTLDTISYTQAQSYEKTKNYMEVKKDEILKAFSSEGFVFEFTMKGKGNARVVFTKTHRVTTTTEPTTIPFNHPTIKSGECFRFRFFECLERNRDSTQ